MNDNHDEHGRFASGGGSSGGGAMKALRGAFNRVTGATTRANAFNVGLRAGITGGVNGKGANAKAYHEIHNRVAVRSTDSMFKKLSVASERHALYKGLDRGSKAYRFAHTKSFKFSDI